MVDFRVSEKQVLKRWLMIIMPQKRMLAENDQLKNSLTDYFISQIEIIEQVFFTLSLIYSKTGKKTLKPITKI